MKLVKSPELREARARAGRIRQGITNYLTTLAEVAAAYEQRDWVTLGYDSWESYVDEEFGAERLRLTPEHRQKAVTELRLAGLSQRAIGTTLGVSHETVRRDLSGGTDVTPDDLPAQVKGSDGKTYAATKPAGPEPLPGPAQDSPADSDAAAPIQSQPGTDASRVDGEAAARPADPPANDGREAGERSSAGVGGTDGAGETAAVETTPTADAPASGDHAVYPATEGGVAPGPVGRAGPGVSPVEQMKALAEQMFADGSATAMPDLVTVLAYLAVAVRHVPVDNADRVSRGLWAADLTRIAESIRLYAESLHPTGAPE